MDEAGLKVELSIQKIGILSNAVNEDCTKRVLEMKLNSLQSIHQESSLLLDKLYLKPSADTDQSKVLKLVNQLENVTTEAQIKITNLLSRFEHSINNVVSTTNPSNTLPRLPKLELPVFEGGYVEWTSFFDLFDCAINQRSDLSEVQKLQYLKGSVRGEPAKIIRTLTLTDKNYAVALDLLKKRYCNKKNIRDCHLSAIFSLKAISVKSSAAIRGLVNSMIEHIQSLDNIGEPVKQWSSILIFIIKERLDSETRLEWEQHSGSKENPTFEEMIEFLLSFARILESATENLKAVRIGAIKSSNLVHWEKCPLCVEVHVITDCSLFHEMEPRQRFNEIKSRGLCFNCFGKHYVANCVASNNCSSCVGRHHDLLHFGSSSNIATTTLSKPYSSLQCEVLLQTALVYIRSSNGALLPCRALLDNGSQVNIVTSRMKRKLQLSGKLSNVNVSGIGVVPAAQVEETVQLSLQSGEFNMCFEALVMDIISRDLPHRDIILDWPELASIPLADPGFGSSSSIDLLIGADSYYKLISNFHNMIKNANQNLYAIETALGWVITGSINVSENVLDKRSYNCTMNPTEQENFQRFWDLEDIPSSDLLSNDNSLAKKHFDDTTCRSSTGKYYVRLPFAETPSLGDSRKAALRRFYNIERRFRKDPAVKLNYVAAMKGYFSNNFAEEVPSHDLSNTNTYYMPHHAVIKESSTTTKVRVVFDASAKSSNGQSLNDILLVGPNLQSPLFDILLRFRWHIFVYIADIEKMYCQIGMQCCDQDFHRFFWREEETDPLKEYRMTTVTFGVASSSYHAQATLQRLVSDEGDAYIEASRVISKDTYMDDVLSGHDTIEEAVIVQGQLMKLVGLGGFSLRKWASNEPALLSSIPEASRQSSIEMSFDELIKTLGMEWNPLKDIFTYNVGKFLHENATGITKRYLLSDLSKIFDPLGLISPVIMVAKILFQSLWLESLSWDDEVPVDVYKKWLSWRRDLSSLDELQIPRCIRLNCDEIKVMQLHGFGDASSCGYAAAVYLRCVFLNGDIRTVLITAKSKVAPIKKTSIPRLELCAALLTANLLVKVKTILPDCQIELRAWSDSTVALYWIKSDRARWKLFVSNRVKIICEHVPASNWRYCPTSDMPADCASKGMVASRLLNHKIWWEGPNWLSEREGFWPSMFTEFAEETNNCEAKQSFNVDVARVEQLCCLSVHKNDIFVLPVLNVEEFSNVNKLFRVTAWLMRWSYYSKYKNKRNGRILTKNEIVKAEFYWIRLVQQDCFSKEINCLHRGEQLHAKSKLLSLSPFMDENNILRVGGRLQKSSLEFDKRHPILLPSKHRLTKLIIESVHLKELHSPLSLTIAIIREKFWILKCRKMVRSVILKCIKCRRFSGAPMKQLMGTLPTVRTEPGRVFLKVGLDYAGPIMMKIKFKRTSMEVKAWIALFVCLPTKAVHIELVTSYSSEAFIEALKRFIARRGKPSDIFCDNGTNFVGASTELKELRNLVMSQEFNEKVSVYLVERSISWHYSPPSGPHFGGLWEAAVKSMKYHFYRIVGGSKLTYEELSTLLYQIEALLNSRPLVPLSSDPCDMQALTPGHFIIGSSFTEIAEPCLLDCKVNRLSRYQYVCQLKQHFWRRWKKEYLDLLQDRQKWKKSELNLQIGDLVLITNENTPASK